MCTKRNYLTPKTSEDVSYVLFVKMYLRRIDTYAPVKTGFVIEEILSARTVSLSS